MSFQNEKSSLLVDPLGKSEFVLFPPHKVEHNRCDNETRPAQEGGYIRGDEDGLAILAPGQLLYATGFRAPELRDLVRRRHYPLVDSLDHYRGSHPPFPNLKLTIQDVTRYQMAWRVMKCSISNGELDYNTCFYYRNALTRRCKNWPHTQDILQLLTALGFSVAALIYGGLHALAWSAHFESSTEQLLWRISACVVMGGLPVVLVLLTFTKFQSYWLIPGYRYTRARLAVRKVIDCLAGLVLLAYVLARGYLVVECFINLSHLPAGAYDVPSWSTYFPHIS